jgi:hypothetical protein
VGVATLDAAPLPARHIVVFNESVCDRFTRIMAALHQHRAAMLRNKAQRSRNRILAARQRRKLRQVRSYDRRNIHQLPKGGDRGLVGQDRAARRDHHGIEDDRHPLETPQPLRDCTGGIGRTDHADLHRIHADVVDDGIDLLQHHLGGDRHDVLHSERVLGGDRRDRGHGVAAQHRHRFDVGLDAGAASGVGTGDDQDSGDH